jgi:hypothetical protein
MAGEPSAAGGDLTGRPRRGEGGGTTYKFTGGGSVTAGMAWLRGPALRAGQRWPGLAATRFWKRAR